MRVLVCGSRNWTDPKIIDLLLQGLKSGTENGDVVVIEGGAPGADSLAGEWADNAVVSHVTYPADWEHCSETCRKDHRKRRSDGTSYCKRVGPRRNQQMLDEGHPDLVLAFVNDSQKSQSHGTHDMLHRARTAGVTTYVIRRG